MWYNIYLTIKLIYFNILKRKIMKKVLTILMAGAFATSAFAVSTSSAPVAQHKGSSATSAQRKSASGTSHKKKHKTASSGATKQHTKTASAAM